MKRTLARRIALIGGLLLFTLALGTTGFVLIAGYPAFDAFYMTLVTISTVGYEELHPLTRAGRVFNSFLILFGVSVMFFAVGLMTQTIIELELHDRFGRKRTRRMIDKLKDHFIVCGYGRVGRHASRELLRAGAPFVVLDRNEARAEQARQAGMLTMVADATRDESLRQAGIARANGLVSALATDADNLFVILSAKTLNPADGGHARQRGGSRGETAPRRGGYGFCAVRHGGSAAGAGTAAAVRGHISRFRHHGDGTRRFGTGLIPGQWWPPFRNRAHSRTVVATVSIEQIQVTAGAEVHSKTLRDLQVRRDLGVIVLAIRKSAGQMLFNPPAETEIAAGDCLIAMGAAPNLHRLELLAGQRPG